MGNTTAKLHSALMADRITAWAAANGRLSVYQKGFLHFEGCYEHNYVLQKALTEAATDRKELEVVRLDLTNAFPSYLMYPTGSQLRRETLSRQCTKT